MLYKQICLFSFKTKRKSGFFYRDNQTAILFVQDRSYITLNKNGRIFITLTFVCSTIGVPFTREKTNFFVE